MSELIIAQKSRIVNYFAYFVRRGEAQLAGSSSVPAHVEMMGLIGAGNNPMVGMTARVAVAIEEAGK